VPSLKGIGVDVRVRLADGARYRDRKRVTASKSAAQRWGQERERHLLQSGHARANRQQPRGIAAKHVC